VTAGSPLFVVVVVVVFVQCLLFFGIYELYESCGVMLRHVYTCGVILRHVESY
jgi:hypothetical protein